MAKREASKPVPGAFRPGHDPRRNPGGRRPAGAIDVQKLARVHTEAAINTLVKCLNSRQAVQAAEALLERGWGKPLQKTENVNWNESPPVDIPTESDEERFERAMKILEILREAGVGPDGENATKGNGEVSPKGNGEIPTPEGHKRRPASTH